MMIAVTGYNNYPLSVTGTTSSTSARNDTTTVTEITQSSISFGKTYKVSYACIENCYVDTVPKYKFNQDYHALQVCFRGKQMLDNKFSKKHHHNRMHHSIDRSNNKRKFYIQKLTKKLWQA